MKTNKKCKEITLQKKLKILFLISIFYLLFVSCSDRNPDFVSKNLESRGGIEKLKSIQSQKITGKFIIRQEQEIPFTLFLKQPNFIRLQSEYQSKQLVSAYDGQNCWWINPKKGINSSNKMPKIEASRLLDLQFFYWGYLQRTKRMGYEIRFLGKENIAGEEFFVLKLISGEEMQNIYLDSESFLERKVTGILKGVGVKAETVFSDYKEVDGVLLAHKLEFIVNGRKDVETIINKIELNFEMDDSIFKMPPQ